MTELRKHMIEDMQLQGLSARTQDHYVRVVADLARYYHRSPNQLNDQDLREYFLYLTNEKKLSRSSTTIALCGIKFFYETTLHQQWPTLELVRPAPEYKLPVVLSRDEVRRILGAVQMPVYRVCLTTIYSCGLRLLEGCFISIAGRAKRTAMFRYRCARWSCCVNCGGLIAPPSACSHPPGLATGAR
jgi:integrase/recombinase XerD